ncbi:MAG: hypothetical protein K0Q79_154 [Flavipsychrobacter sp.]|nr:hypothetical protein [Flavipsychrobacter sp.]
MDDNTPLLPGNNEGHIEDIHTEIEIKKIKLALEHGMDFSNSYSNPDTPPEVEGQFLDYIQQWEDQFAKHKTISVYDFTGNPSFRPLSEIPDSEIEIDLNRIMDIMQQHSVDLGTLCAVDDKELYRFIIEELFLHEMNDIRIEGMRHCFTYEEFHPNHEYDIKNRCTEIIEHITDKKRSDLIPWGLADNVMCRDTFYTKDELNKKMLNFRDSFRAIALRDFQYTSVTVNNDDGHLTSQAIATSVLPD